MLIHTFSDGGGHRAEFISVRRVLSVNLYAGLDTILYIHGLHGGIQHQRGRQALAEGMPHHSPIDCPTFLVSEWMSYASEPAQAQKSSRTSKFIKRLLQPSNVLLVALWSFFFFLVYYVQVRLPPPLSTFSTSAQRTHAVLMPAVLETMPPLALSLLCKGTRLPHVRFVAVHTR